MNLSTSFSFVSSNWKVITTFSVPLTANGVLYIYVNNKRFSSQEVLLGATTAETILTSVTQGSVYVKLYMASNVIGPSFVRFLPSELNNTTISKSFLYDSVLNDQSFILEWSENVTDKLTNGRLLPSYVGRTSSDGASTDFNSLWSTITKLFAYYVSYGKKLSTFWLDFKLAKEFALQKGYFLNQKDDLATVNSILNSFFKLSKKRGTFSQNTFETGLDQSSELYNFLDLDYYQDFLAVHHGEQNTSWMLNKTSPLWRGLGNYEVNKANQLSLLSQVGTVVEAIESSEKVWKLTTSNFFGVNGSSPKISIDCNVDYELGFYAKASNQIMVKIALYDADQHLLDMPVKLIDGTPSDVFVNNYVLPSINKYYFFRFFLFGSDFQLTSLLDKPNQTQLRLIKGAEKLVLIIKPITGTLDLKDLYFRPIYTPSSRGLIQSSNLVSLWVPSTIKENFIDVRQQLANKFFPYHYYFTPVKLSENLVRNLPCVGNQTPQMVLSGRIRCQIVNGLKTGVVEEELIDNNPCTNYPSSWQTSSQSLNCATCLPSGQTIATFVETRELAPFFVYQSNNYKVKTTTRTSNGSCGYTTSIVYSLLVDDNPNERNEDPLWENSGLPYCTNSPTCTQYVPDVEDVTVELGTCQVNIFSYIGFVDEKQENSFSISLLEIEIL